MSDNKMVQVIFRVTKEEEEAISEKARSRNISVNQFIKNCIFENEKTSDSTTKEDDSKDDSRYDIASDIISILNEQLRANDAINKEVTVNKTVSIKAGETSQLVQVLYS
ncbi:hypothetical protein IYQ92_04265 [Streptococcus sp. HF-1907]|uniref:plasmid mobilization protein n=1 Tax=Streptococcus sp. HF-1907 TaxID=2785793 RepID=UPI00189D4B05|nr:hypothetical protein [Streptococcus sp. HF-1907]MBF7094467.1 hypothetical protein [Streptococcus sp. HF-1907]